MSEWIMLRQVAPDDSRVWAVGCLDARTKAITHLSWYYTEDEARLAHHRMEHGA